MDEREYAAAEIDLWECALNEQREAEYDILVAHRSGNALRVQELRWTVDILRTRADLLLAEAVRVMCVFRNGRAQDRFTETRVGLISKPLRVTREAP